MWIVEGRSESGDEYPPQKFRKKPTKKELSEWAHSRDGNFGDPKGYERGPGYDGSYVYLRTYEL